MKIAHAGCPGYAKYSLGYEDEASMLPDFLFKKIWFLFKKGLDIERREWNDGEFHLMELELTEPYLYSETHANAYEHYYEALLELAKPRVARRIEV